MRRYKINPKDFDGTKFATRYGLNALAGDFWMATESNGESYLYLRSGISIISDPPVFEPPNASEQKVFITFQEHPLLKPRTEERTLNISVISDSQLEDIRVRLGALVIKRTPN
jgi:hypothetical protein